MFRQIIIEVRGFMNFGEYSLNISGIISVMVGVQVVLFSTVNPWPSRNL